MGGLSAGALLATEGLSVIVVERLPRIGGRCSTIEYRGYKCTTGVIGVETKGVVEDVFNRVGANVGLRPAGPARYLIKGKLVETGPAGLKRLLDAAADNEQDAEGVRAAFSRAMAWREPSDSVTLRDWLRCYTSDDAIVAVFQAMVAATLMLYADEVPAGFFFRFLKRLGGVKDFGYSPSGSLALPRTLKDTIETRSGDVWTGCQVNGIRVHNGTATGATVSKNGQEFAIDAKAVISNVGPKATVNLAGAENFDDWYLDQLDRQVIPAPIVALHIASNEPLIEHNCILVTGSRRINALYQPTLVCPELAPPGKHLLLAGAGPESSAASLDRKSELGHCLADLRDLIPDFDRRGEVLLAGCYHRNWPGMHCWPGRDLPVKTPVVNLYDVGDGAKPSGTTALPGTMASALEVVEELKRRI